MALRSKVLFVGVTWSILSGAYQATAPSIVTPLVWPYLVGQQVFYWLGIPAVSPIYFYMLGVALWSTMFFALGSLIEGVWLEAKAKARKKGRRAREYKRGG